MMKLIYANFMRLMKNRIFWGLEIFSAGYSVFVYSMAARNLENNFIVTNWNLYFFNGMFMMGAVMAVFIS